MAQSILSTLKKAISKVNPSNVVVRDQVLQENELVAYVREVKKKFSQEDSIRHRRYDIMMNFYEGRQWDNDIYNGGDQIIRNMSDYGEAFGRSRPQGSTQFTFNKIAPVCDKYVEFLAVEQLEPRSQKELEMNADLMGPDEVAQNPVKETDASTKADKVEKLGRSILFTDNDSKAVLARVAEQSGMLGDGFFRSVTNPITKKVQISFVNAYNVTAWWKDDSYSEFAGLIYTSEIDFGVAKQSPEEGGLNVGGVLDVLTEDDVKKNTDDVFRANESHSVLMQDVWIDLSYWNTKGEWIPKCRNFILVGKIKVKDEIIDEPFPYYHVPFKRIPGSGWGEPPAWQAISIQVGINMAISDEADIIKFYASPWIIDENSGQNPNDIIGSAQGPKIVPINEGGRLYFLEWSGRVYSLSDHINRLNKAFDDVTGMPAIAYGAIDASLATGVALTTSFQPTIQKIKRWTQNWNIALSKMWKHNLMRLEMLTPEAKNFIQGNYGVKWDWGERAPRDESIHITNTINKKNAGLLSDETAMENLGVASPIDEKIRIAFEKNNAYYNPELAITKLQAWMQYDALTKQLAAQAQAAQAPAQPGPGGAAPTGEIPGNQGGDRTAVTSAAPNLPPNLNNVPQPMAQPGVAAGSFSAPAPGPMGQ